VTNPDTVASVLSSEDAPAGPAARWGVARRRERAARDEEFTMYVATAAPRLRRIAFLMCRDWHLAQDLTQITFVKMYASWGRIWRTANLDAYSRRVLLNAVFDQKKRRSDSEVMLADLPDTGAHWRRCRFGTRPSWCCATGRTRASTRSPRSSGCRSRW
jgi:hypothetical protein